MSNELKIRTLTERFLEGETVGMEFIEERRERLDEFYYGCPPLLGFLLH